MAPRPVRPASHRVSLGSLFQRAMLAVPVVLLAASAVRLGGKRAALLGLGASLFVMVGALLSRYRRRLTLSPVTWLFASYLGAVAWIWLSVPQHEMDAFVHLAQGVLWVVPLAIVAYYTVFQTGSHLYGRAQSLSGQIAMKSSWPRDLRACRELPEVKALGEALQFDAGPALYLLDDPRPQVRLCVLAALEYRDHWQSGQPEAVLALLRREDHAEIRAAAVNALAACEDRRILEVVADSLRDTDARVRQAAVAALFWDTERRWAWMRFGLRNALSDPNFDEDFSLLQEGQKLSEEAVNDLIAWSSEKGLLSFRSAETLAAHFANVLQEKPEETMDFLFQTLEDPHASPVLRIEFARLLHANQALDTAKLEELLNPANPTSLRLLAAEGLLDAGPHAGATACLREMARLPNRELALSAAEVVQRFLGVDLGLALGQPLPHLNSPKAIDVTRRLMAWGAEQDDASDDALEPSAASFGRLSLR